ncbi:carbon-nitrogen hydrolase [Solemya velum gill symbiont]|uniref:Acyltransferase n=1 Tax=Solemya velum gill symbiont TaxID=2340 RepID=A0A0B0HEV5_SOVGS|nr:carbon-nitrogen hydrolase [Solemya velum gill symbiont]KHF25986.1 amidohydrolase [Solemya velum gill symbiont]OOY34022.1 acyltransferase [Solemya velum gill symbiont]OOY36655.1 acyltransferase [Solemya velum gill symbiont]OOY39485.1 acyltransferase [Solemya velum gill symbiont]OOY43119.1 acyltransferase [Solemya velum gill symbiont]
MNSNEIKVALIQQAAAVDSVANLDSLEQSIRTAAASGAKLIVLQELHNTPYFCQQEEIANFDLAETIPGPSTERFGRIASENGCVIVTSLFEKRATGLYHNTAVVIDADGSIAGCYRKMHIPDDPGFYEKFYFTPGDLGFTPIDTSVGRLGVLVCWDQWYPEAARAMALAGAELLVYPTSIGWDSRDDEAEQQRQLEAWITVQRGHSVANGLPVIACNRVGHEKDPGGHTAGINFWGNSFICGPQGEFLARADEKAVTLAATVSLGRSEEIRRIWPFLRDRRIDAYGDLLRRYID